MSRKNRDFRLPILVIVSFLLLTLLIWPCPSARASRSQPARHAEPAVKSRLLMAHYMPWFEARPYRMQWGWHWTMNHYDPEQVRDRQEAASHYYPLIGLYDSDDPDTLECHALLMKYAGIDGVIVDWYGTDDFLDYGINHRNTQHLIEFIQKAGLHFAICYEDQTVPKLIAGRRIAAADAIPHGQQLMQWVQQHWFASPSYLRLEQRPVWLVFGGGYYREEQWKQIFAPQSQPPEFFTEMGRRAPAVGGFGWPVPTGGTEQSFKVLDSFYTRAKDWPQFIPAAYPRFHDIYHEAGVHNSWGFIDDNGGKTYKQTLQRALQSSASIIQLVTWNDWGEGTMIEPSVEFGYRDLETTQRLRRKYIEPTFPYKPQDLRLPVELYKLRKNYQGNAAVQAKLDAISRLLFAGRLERARTLLAAYPNDPRAPTAH